MRARWQGCIAVNRRRRCTARSYRAGSAEYKRLHGTYTLSRIGWTRARCSDVYRARGDEPLTVSLFHVAIEILLIKSPSLRNTSVPSYGFHVRIVYALGRGPIAEKHCREISRTLATSVILYQICLVEQI